MLDKPNTALEPMVRKLSYWAEFDDEDRAALLGLPHQTRDLERNSYIVREFDTTTHSCALLSGVAMRHKVVLSGARQIVAIQMQGDIVDIQNSFLGVADHSVQVLTDSKATFIPRDAVKALAFARPKIGLAMWIDSLVDASIFREWITNLGRRDARTRLAHLLCEFSLRLKVAGLGEETEYELPMTQEQLADCTGLTPVHLNRKLMSLERDGLIERRSARTITIGDWKKLAQAGEFSSTYLHLKANEPALR